MSDDLAKLLRAKRTYTTSAGVMEEWINPDGPMAADRIEAQAAEIERLRDIVAIMHTAFAAYADSPAKQEAITLAGKAEQ